MCGCDSDKKSWYEIYKGTTKSMEILFLMHDCPYIMDEEDELKLEVRDYRNDNSIVIEKSSKGDNYFSFIPSDTENLDVGYYNYNVKLYPADSDEIYEVIKPSMFFIKAGE